MVSRLSKFLSVAGLLLATLISGPAGAAILTVSNLNDSGRGSLRQAILNANAAAGADTIRFAVSGTVVLDSTLPNIISGSTITIDGTGRHVTVSGNHAVRVMFVDAGARLYLKNLTVADGLNQDSGGGIFNQGKLAVIHCTVSGNRAFNLTENSGGRGAESTTKAA